MTPSLDSLGIISHRPYQVNVKGYLCPGVYRRRYKPTATMVPTPSLRPVASRIKVTEMDSLPHE